MKLIVTSPDQADEPPAPAHDPATTRRFAIVSLVVAVTLTALIGGAVLGRRDGSDEGAAEPAPAGGLRPSADTVGRVLSVSARAGGWAAEADGSRQRPFGTITEALARARAGDTVAVGPGVYDGFRTVRAGSPDTPIRLVGSAAVIRGDGEGHLVEVRHDHLTIEGFEMSKADILVYIFNATGVRVVDNVLHHARGECVRLKYRATRNEVAGNRIERCGSDFDAEEGEKNGEGVYIGTAPEQLDRNPTDEPDASDHNWVHDNVISTPAECVDIKEGASDNVVEDNHCRGGQDPDGAGFSSRGNSNIFRDNVSEGHDGSGIRLGGDDDNDGVDNVVTGNRFVDNEGYGVKVQRLPQRRICDNVVGGNGEGDTNDAGPDPTEAC